MNQTSWKHWLLAKRIYLLLLVYIVAITLAFGSAILIHDDMVITPESQALLLGTLPWILVVKLTAFHFFGSFHGWWRYVTFADLAAILRVAVVSTLVIAVIDRMLVTDHSLSPALLLLDCGATILWFGGLRSVCRLVREHVLPAISFDDREPALIIGAVQGGEALARQIHNQTLIRYRVVGFLDENLAFRGSRLGGIPFLGSPRETTRIAKEHQVETVLVITNSMSGKRLRRLVNSCRTAQISLKMIPPINELLSGDYRPRVRDVDINDLLRRDPVQLDMEAIDEMLQGRCVMVSGAGGSIGSEICRQILRCQPDTLILLERAENSLYHIGRELQAKAQGCRVIHYLADVRDYERMHHLFQRYQPEIVFHAAAHKHVPMMEHNPSEAINNNVFGTKRLADMAGQYGVSRFVMISTDKAVNPTSIMGVSKMVAERYVHASSEAFDTKYVVVRFGNVLASAGSVVPLFQEQIRKGGPVTVTHPEMERFFMTIPEASQLVLQAAAMGKGGEIFVLDMGDPVKIVDLARDMIRLSGLSLNDIEIRITGVRPGEKLYEELYQDEETTLPTPHPKLRVAYHRPESRQEVLDLIAELAPLVDEPDRVIVQRLQELTPEYIPPQAPKADPDEVPSTR